IHANLCLSRDWHSLHDMDDHGFAKNPASPDRLTGVRIEARPVAEMFSSTSPEARFVTPPHHLPGGPDSLFVVNPLQPAGAAGLGDEVVGPSVAQAKDVAEAARQLIGPDRQHTFARVSRAPVGARGALVVGGGLGLGLTQDVLAGLLGIGPHH